MLIKNLDDPLIMQIFKKISPDAWTLTQLSGGNTNTVALVTSSKHTYIIRLYGSEGVIDRSAEYINMAYLYRFDLAPAIIFKFKNGIITEYIPGTQLYENDLKNESSQILSKMMNWHNLPKYQFDSITFTHPYLNLQSAILSFNEGHAILIPTLRKWYDLALPQHAVVLNSFKIKETIDEIEKDTLHCKVSFCHNDLLAANIIKGDVDNIFFIDFEYAGYNFQSFDVANHFAEYAGYELKIENIPDAKQISLILPKYYAKDLYEIMYFIPVSHLFWGIWGLLRKGEFDFYQYGLKRLTTFVETYERLIREF